MYYAIKTKTSTGATHTKFIYPEQKLRCTAKTCSNDGKYIDQRARFLHGSTVAEALDSFAFSNAKNKLKKYRICDLKYDLKVGRLEVV